MDNELDTLTRLLEEAGAAHHDAFAHVGGDDPDWPTWYASFLQPKLGSAVEVADLAALLGQAADEHKASGSEERWPPFYAQFLAARGIS